MPTKVIPGKQGARNLTVRLIETDINAEDIVRNIIYQNNGIILTESGMQGDYLDLNYAGKMRRKQGVHVAGYLNLQISARFPSTRERDNAYSELKEVV